VVFLLLGRGDTEMKKYLLLVLFLGLSSIVSADYVSHSYNKMDVNRDKCTQIIKASATKIGFNFVQFKDYNEYTVLWGANKNSVSFQYVCVPNLKVGYLIVNGSDHDKELKIMSKFQNEIYLKIGN